MPSNAALRTQRQGIFESEASLVRPCLKKKETKQSQVVVLMCVLTAHCFLPPDPTVLKVCKSLLCIQYIQYLLFVKKLAGS